MDTISTPAMAWCLDQRDVYHRKRLRLPGWEVRWEEGIEVPPVRSTWGHFLGSSWSKRLAGAQEREKKRERCSQPQKRWIACGYRGSWHQRQQMQKEEQTIAWLGGKAMSLYQDLMHLSKLWGHQRWLQCGVGTLREANGQGGLCFVLSWSPTGTKQVHKPWQSQWRCWLW